MHANLCSFVLVEQCFALSNSAVEIFVDPGFYVRVREEGSSNPPGRRPPTSGGSRIFLRGVSQLPILLLFCNYFAENCMKMKEFGPGGASLAAPLDPPMPTVYSDEYLQPN